MVELSTLDLRSNPITEIEFDSFGSSSWRVLRVNSTQFLCDCNIFWFTQWLQNRTQLVSLHEDVPRCHHPADLKGKSLLEIDTSELKCDLNPRPTMITDPKSKSVQVGSDTKFACSARTTEIETIEIEWYYQELENSVTKVMKEEPDFVSIKHARPVTVQSGNTVQSTLIMRNLDKNAIGFYKCLIKNQYGHVHSSLAHLQVHQVPGFSTRPKNQTVSLHSKVKLICQAKGYPEPVISWTRDDGYNFEEVRGRLELSNDVSTLTIANVNVNDTGKFTCTASNSAGNITADVYIKMAPSETLIRFDKNVKYKIGSDAVLKCNYPTIYPPVKVMWYFNNTMLNITKRHFFTEEENVLVIDSTRERDSGLYQCKIYNSLGSASGVTKLEVLSQSQMTGEMPYWVWIVGVAFSAIFLTSLIWLVVFCRTRTRRGHSDLGTDETNLPLPLERHLMDNQKHAQRMAAMSHSRQNDLMRHNYDRETPMTASSSERDTLLDGSRTPNSIPPQIPQFHKPIPNFGSMYHQLHQPMYSPYAPYPGLHPQFNSPFVIPQNPNSKVEMPYRPPFMNGPGPPMWTPRAQTMPDLDNNYQHQQQHHQQQHKQHQHHPHIAPPRFPHMGGGVPSVPHIFPQTPTRSVHNFPNFFKGDLDLNFQSSAPGPDRSRRKARRSEPAHSLHQFTPTKSTRNAPTAKLKDDDGIVQRLLGPIETTPPKLTKSTQSINNDHYKKERRKTEH